MRRLRRFLALPAPERGLLLRAAILLALIRLGLWLLPFRTLRRLLARLAQVPARGRGSGSIPPERIVWAVSVASRIVPGTGTCLVRALAAQVLLVRRGHPSRLRLGVARNEKGRLEAHAWLESQGTIVIGGEESPSRFAPLPPLKGEQPWAGS
jgi:hypothetical protein